MAGQRRDGIDDPISLFLLHHHLVSEKMHRALEIPDVVHMVCGYLPADLSGSSRTLAALASTCKVLRDPALGALWRTQTSIIPLLSCMPEDLFNINPISATAQLPLRLTRPINTTDWERSDPYASRVRHFRFRTLPGLEHIYPVLDVCVPGGFMFPYLRSLAWTSRKQPAEDFPYIRIFLAPALLSINFYFAGSIMNCSLLATLGRICPNLTDIDLYCLHRDHKGEVASELAISQLVRSLRHLTSFSFYDNGPSPGTVEYLAQLPSLTSLGLFSFPTEFPLTSISQTRFTGLQNLNIQSLGIHALDQFVKITAGLALQSLTLILELFPVGELRKLYSALAQSASRHSLATIEIGFHDDLHVLPSQSADYAVNDELLRILFAFTNITNLSVMSAVDFNVSDATLADAARAWPRMEALTLCVLRHSPTPPPRVTLTSLHSFAEHCPHLWFLAITLDATAIPPSRNPCVPQRQLTHLRVTHSPISAPSGVARLLSDIFPNVKHVSYEGQSAPAALGAWKTVECFFRIFTAGKPDTVNLNVHQYRNSECGLGSQGESLSVPYRNGAPPATLAALDFSGSGEDVNEKFQSLLDPITSIGRDQRVDITPETGMTLANNVAVKRPLAQYILPRTVRSHNLSAVEETDSALCQL
ncbi:hypothetical protein C8R47DRAFT_1064180 [Mycena vitilis]|nr:hypothetical protein C8R47DRAFT_1064180 [Mycena vitilis]